MSSYDNRINENKVFHKELFEKHLKPLYEIEYNVFQHLKIIEKLKKAPKKFTVIIEDEEIVFQIKDKNISIHLAIYSLWNGDHGQEQMDNIMEHINIIYQAESLKRIMPFEIFQDRPDDHFYDSDFIFWYVIEDEI